MASKTSNPTRVRSSRTEGARDRGHAGSLASHPLPILWGTVGRMKGSKRKRGAGWELRAYAGQDPVTGKKRWRSHTIPACSARAADDALRDWCRTVARGRGGSGSTTLSDLIAEWVDMIEPERSPTTIVNYRTIATRHIEPALGRKAIATLTAADLDRFYRGLAEHGLAPATIQRVHAVVRGALSQAVRWDWLEGNVAQRARPPRVPKPELRGVSLDELAHLIATAWEQDPEFAMLLRLAAATGARRGELCGLQWRDLDGDVLAIRRGVVCVEGTVTVQGTKTHQERTVALDSGTVDLLAAYRQGMLERARHAEVRLGPQSYLWSRLPSGREPLRPDLVTGAFRRLAKACGCQGAHFHDLRHLHASTLLDQGQSIAVISERLGHAKISTTLDMYVTARQGRDREAADTFGRLLDP